MNYTLLKTLANQGPYKVDEKEWFAERHKYQCGIKGNSKDYKDKNSNIEYYTDEKGNIKKVKKQR